MKEGYFILSSDFDLVLSTVNIDSSWSWISLVWMNDTATRSRLVRTKTWASTNMESWLASTHLPTSTSTRMPRVSTRMPRASTRLLGSLTRTCMPSASTRMLMYLVPLLVPRLVYLVRIWLVPRRWIVVCWCTCCLYSFVCLCLVPRLVYLVPRLSRMPSASTLSYA